MWRTHIRIYPFNFTANFFNKTESFFLSASHKSREACNESGRNFHKCAKNFFFYWMSLLEGVQISLMYTKKLWNNDILSNWVNSYVFYIEISPFRPSGNICLTLLSTREKCVCMFVYISIIWKCYLHSHFISLPLSFCDNRTKKIGFFPHLCTFHFLLRHRKAHKKE